jgi:hypothetical protein
MMSEATHRHRHRSAFGAPAQRACAAVDAVPVCVACVFRGAAGLPILMPSLSHHGFIMLHQPSATRTFLMTAGEHRVLHTPSGSRWFAARGDARLTEPPRWLGERLVGIELVLHDGAEHVFESGGWIGLHAASDCALTCETRRPVASFLMAIWRIIRPGRALRASA